MGCPVPKIVNNGEGSALLQSPARIRELTAAVKAAVPLPVSVKLRIGFTEQTVNIEETACAAVEGGADLITIHGRTRSQMYRPGIDYAAIRRGVEAAKGAVPVLGNGDIFCAADARAASSPASRPPAIRATEHHCPLPVFVMRHLRCRTSSQTPPRASAIEQCGPQRTQSHCFPCALCGKEPPCSVATSLATI